MSNATTARKRFTLTAPVSASPSSDGDRTVDFIASTSAINANGYRIDQTGWDLSRYAANPVVLFNHADAKGMGITGYDPNVSLPIGRAENVRVERDALRCTIRFATEDANPMAERVYRLVQQGMLNAVSVGFDALDVVVDVVDEVEIPRVTRAELYEISLATIPADAGAVRASSRAALMQLSHGRPGITSTKTTRTAVVHDGFTACGVTVLPQSVEVPLAPPPPPEPTEWERLSMVEKHRLATKFPHRFEEVLEAHRRARPGCTF